MPALRSTMTKGKIVSWVKSKGKVLSKGESIVVVEFDKANMDVETFYDWILAPIIVGECETAPVGDGRREASIRGHDKPTTALVAELTGLVMADWPNFVLFFFLWLNLRERDEKVKK